MIEVHTSLLEASRYCAHALGEHFCFVAVYYGDIPEPARTIRLQTLVQELYQQHKGKILSLAKDAKQHQRYVLMLKKGDTLARFDPSLASYPMEGPLFPADWLVRKLLVRALPRILQPHTRNWFETDGLFYISDIKPIPGHSGSEVVAIEVTPEPSKGTRYQSLALKTVTFTPFDLHQHTDGKTYRKAVNKPRYRLDIASQSLSRCGDGDYVRLARSTKRRNRTRALDARPGQIEQFYKSKVGVLAQFLEDFRQAYGELAHIELQSLKAEQIKIKDKDVTLAYREIHRLLGEHQIFIINRSDDAEAPLALAAELTRLGFNSVHASAIMPDSMNLLIVNEAAEYTQQKHRDPYRLERQRHPDAVIQSCTPQRLQESTLTHVVEVLLKELLIKREVSDRRLLFDYPTIPAGRVFILPVRPEEPEEGLKYDARWPWACASLEENRLALWWADQAFQEEVGLYLNPQQHRELLTGYDRPAFIFSPQNGELMLITDTQAVTLPDHATLHQYLNDIEGSRQQPVPTRRLTDYLAADSDMPEDLRCRLNQLLNEAQQRELTAARLLETIGYRKKDERAVYDFLAEHGYRLKASLSAEGGVLTGTTGIWVNHAHQLYFAGAKGSPRSVQSTFGHIYHLENSNAGIPEWYLAALEVYHVRHRNPTIMPFIFKHLREYVQSCQAALK